MKKKLILFLLALTLVLAGCSGGEKKTEEDKSGKFPKTVQASAEGFNKDVPIEIEVTFDENKAIQEIKVLKQEETEAIGAVALQKLPDLVVQAQSLEIDTIAGATVSSTAFLSAVKDAMDQAGVSEADLKPQEVTKDGAKEYEVDVAIIGAGGAGLAASIEAKDQGADVLILEKAAFSGGNTVKATGGMNAAKTPYQDENTFSEAEESAIRKQIEVAREKYPDLKELTDTVEGQLEAYLKDPQGYFDSPELFMLDTMVGGHGINNPDKVKALTDHSAATIEWLKENDMPLTSVGNAGGASVKRIHRPVDADGKTMAVGNFLVPRLTELAEKKGVKILYSTPATELLVDDNHAVIGVQAGDVTVHAKSVIIASGGFGADLERVASLKPELKGFVTTNAPGITGDGIDMATKIGAATVDMDQIQIHPTVEQETSSLITEGVRGDGAILINQEGKRFIDEVATRDVVSAAEIAQPGGYAYLIFDQAMVDQSAPLAGYISKGFAIQGEDLESLAKAIEVDPASFTATMTDWNAAVAAKSDPAFGRTAFTEPLAKAPYFAIKLSPGIHHTMGGLVTDSDCRVLQEADQAPIANLFAAGEVTGGVHGANRLGGSAVSDIMVFGRIAGQKAAENAK